MSAAPTFDLPGDGGPVVVHRTLPEGQPRAGIVIVHGMAEHAARYARFARELAVHGIAAYAPDHRGHGETARGAFGHGGPDAWNGMLRDLARLARVVRAALPGSPLFVFGHSMGSVLAQRFAQLHGEELAGLILSGTTGSAPALASGIAAARLARVLGGARRASPLQGRIFAGFNAPFEQRTGFEWLSRDRREVQAYVDDPRCGFTFSNGLLLDMLRGYAETWRPQNERRIPARLPVLMLSGEHDPVARNGDAVCELAERYRALGLDDVRVTIYPGGRHEMLNEVNRDDVVRDILAWIDARVR